MVFPFPKRKKVSIIEKQEVSRWGHFKMAFPKIQGVLNPAHRQVGIVELSLNLSTCLKYHGKLKVNSSKQGRRRADRHYT